MTDVYTQLMNNFKEVRLLGSIGNVLSWDLNTYMPSKAVTYRSQQFNWLHTKIHLLWTSEETRELVEQFLQIENPDKFQSRNVELMKREIENRTCLPTELVGQLASQSNKTLEVWKKAKEKKVFQDVAPDLEKLFELNLKKSHLIADKKGISDPYEALIGTRDPSFTVGKLTILFDDVKSFLVKDIEKITNHDVKTDNKFLKEIIPRETQVNLVKDLATFLEYDFKVGRIDEVEHPLTIPCGPSDIRVTVKYQEDNVMKAFGAGVHEIGHALHGLQRKKEWSDLPVNNMQYPSFGESQSRLLEKHIGLSRAFWQAYYPRFQKGTNGAFTNIPQEDFYKAINEVTPGFSRMGADEVTYILHIILRFEIERDLFAEKITVKELPTVWNEKYLEYLGVDVPNDTLGVMQDLHWFSQYWGYFFGYGIGDLMAAQIVEAGLSKDIPDWQDTLARGTFTPIREWLASNTHEIGALYDSLESIEHITGAPLSAKFFKNYIKDKYSTLYL
ncbi:MAG: carboxypeptidase M32 [Candidatus Heimdallarchaeota archaeon]|nr:carboxypeptidase M32 [Candidatus Heimdallarchaeota archaeon]